MNNVQQQEIPRYFARTVLSQAHLSPFCMHVSPVLWDWDHALTLHPLPDLVVVADKFGKFAETQAGKVFTVYRQKFGTRKIKFRIVK